jgi:hypothetical protein
MDELEARAANYPQTELPVTHRFTDGLYSREIFMPANTLVTSRTHLTEHPFVILSGIVDVIDEQGVVTQYHAPYVGTTKPNTRRVLVTVTDTRWITFHVTSKTDPDEIGQEITTSENSLLKPEFRQAYLTGEAACLGQ